MDDQRRLTEIIRVRDNIREYAADIVIRETFLKIIVNGYKLVSLACLDDMLIELGIGYLFSEGIVKKYDEIISSELLTTTPTLNIETTRSDSFIENYLTGRTKVSGCGGGMAKNSESEKLNQKQFRPFNSFPFDLEKLSGLMTEFQSRADLFKSTGGVHSAALINNKKLALIAYADDIGRHNAVDKVIGWAALNGKKFSECTLLTTGRISFEIASKAAILNIPALISRSAPTSKAIDIAYRNGLYLLGFARGNRYNIYTGLGNI